jgi:hypothetical protein
MPPYPVPLRFILIISSHLCLDLCFWLSYQHCVCIMLLCMRVTCLAHLILTWTLELYLVSGTTNDCASNIISLASPEDGNRPNFQNLSFSINLHFRRWTNSINPVIKRKQSNYTDRVITTVRRS